MDNLIQNILERGRAFGIPNSEQFAIMATPIFHRPLSGVVNNGKYFGGNVSKLSKRRK